MNSQSEESSSDECDSKIPFSKKSTKIKQPTIRETSKSPEQLKNADVIRKCMKYMNKVKTSDLMRDYDIEMAIEQYMADQTKHVFELLDEIEFYPAGLQK